MGEDVMHLTSSLIGWDHPMFRKMIHRKYILILFSVIVYPDKFDGLVQERCNSSALAMELRLSCTYPSSCPWCLKYVRYISLYRVNQQIIWADEATKSYYESVCWWMNCMWWALFIYFFNCASMGIFCQKFNTIAFMSFQCLWTHLHSILSFECALSNVISMSFTHSHECIFQH